MFQSINQSIGLFDDTTSQLTNAITIYIADLECSKAKYPECLAGNDIYRA